MLVGYSGIGVDDEARELVRVLSGFDAAAPASDEEILRAEQAHGLPRLVGVALEGYCGAPESGRLLAYAHDAILRSDMTTSRSGARSSRCSGVSRVCLNGPGTPLSPLPRGSCSTGGSTRLSWGREPDPGGFVAGAEAAPLEAARSRRSVARASRLW